MVDGRWRCYSFSYSSHVTLAGQGWNVFQREFMAGKQRHPSEWKKKLKECSRIWTSMKDDAKEIYRQKAADEQTLRNEASVHPLDSKAAKAAKGGSSQSAASSSDPPPVDSFGLCRNALKAVSRQRLMSTYTAFRESTAWKEFDGIPFGI